MKIIQRALSSTVWLGSFFSIFLFVCLSAASFDAISLEMKTIEGTPTSQCYPPQDLPEIGIAQYCVSVPLQLITRPDGDVLFAILPTPTYCTTWPGALSTPGYVRLRRSHLGFSTINDGARMAAAFSSLYWVALRPDSQGRCEIVEASFIAM